MCVDWSKVKRVMRRGVEILKLFQNGEQIYPIEQGGEDVVEIVWENANAGSIGGLPTFDRDGESHYVDNLRSASIDCYKVVNGERTKVNPQLGYYWSSSNPSAFSVENTTRASAEITCNLGDDKDGSATITRYADFYYDGAVMTISCATTAYKEAYEEPEVPEEDYIVSTRYEISGVSLTYGSLDSNSGSRAHPMYNYTIYEVDVYKSGKEERTNVTNNAGVTPSISFSKAGFGFSIDSDSGVVTASSSNTSSSDEELGTAFIEVSYGGAIGRASDTIVQAKATASVSNISADWVELPREEGELASYALVIHNGNDVSVSIDYEIVYGPSASGSAYINANGVYYTSARSPRPRAIISESYTLN